MNTLNSVISTLFEAVSDEKFWDFVRRCDWTRDHDYERIKMKMLRSLTKEEVAAYRDTYDQVRSKLNAKINDVVSGVGDDSYSDLLAHIVGSGKELYDSVIEDPSIAQRIIDNHDYQESFSYAFPYPEDWKMLDKKPHIKRAQEAINVLSDPNFVNGIKSEATASVYKDVLTRLKLVVNGKFEQAVDGWDRDSWRDWGALINEIDADIHYGPPNVLIDVKKYFFKQ